MKYRTVLPRMAMLSSLTGGWPADAAVRSVHLTDFRCVFICGSTAARVQASEASEDGRTPSEARKG